MWWTALRSCIGKVQQQIETGFGGGSTHRIVGLSWSSWVFSSSSCDSSERWGAEEGKRGGGDGGGAPKKGGTPKGEAGRGRATGREAARGGGESGAGVVVRWKGGGHRRHSSLCWSSWDCRRVMIHLSAEARWKGREAAETEGGRGRAQGGPQREGREGGTPEDEEGRGGRGGRGEDRRRGRRSGAEEWCLARWRCVR